MLTIRASSGERKIYDILKDNGFHFKEEYSFKDLVSPNGVPYRFDFAVFDDDGEIDFLIEFQGKQHYSPKTVFGGLPGLRKQQLYDMRKREYCKKHNIKLIIIPYTEEYYITYDYIIKKAYGI